MKITPYEQNAKKHTNKQLKQLADVIKEVGWRQPALVNRNGVIIAGHGRWATWEKFGELMQLPEIWVINDAGKTIMGAPASKPMTEEQEKMYRLADNKLNESPWELDIAMPDLQSLSKEMFALTGFDFDLLLEPDSRDDEIPEKVPARAKLGDLYQLGPHRLMCGDSTQDEAVSMLCGGKYADMVFTDPPYGVKYVGKTKESLTIENDDKSDNGELESFLLSAFSVSLKYTKPGSGYYVAAPPGPLHNTFGKVLKELGIWRQTLNWVKDVFVMGRSDYHYRHEPLFYGWAPGGKHNFYGGRKVDTVWEIPRPKRSTEHPTMKPVALVERAIVNSSERAGIVLDLFLGGGSTLIACEKTGRVCYGMELDPKYVDVCIARWEKFTDQKAKKLAGDNSRLTGKKVL